MNCVALSSFPGCRNLSLFLKFSDHYLFTIYSLDIEIKLGFEKQQAELLHYKALLTGDPRVRDIRPLAINLEMQQVLSETRNQLLSAIGEHCVVYPLKSNFE